MLDVLAASHTSDYPLLPILLGVLGAVVGAVVGAAVALWRNRSAGPTSVAMQTTAAVLLIEQLQHRITSLEARVESLEDENDRYRKIHGPLPPPQPAPVTPTERTPR